MNRKSKRTTTAGSRETSGPPSTAAGEPAATGMVPPLPPSGGDGGTATGDNADGQRPLTPKRRQILHREHLILRKAQPMVRDEGLAGLSMDRIAAEMQYAKGTIYNHFACKEEIVMALAVRAVQRRLALFDAAATLPGNSRRRMMAIGLACEFYVDQFPDDFAIERLVRNDHVVSKSSPQRRELLGSCESRCMLIVAGIVRDAVAAGDLQLPNDVCADTQSSRVKKTSIGAED
ncbi:MAG: TetR/AcrR family transcriptional regulator, partial [Planctomycetota bacterium]